ncbi:MAG: ATP-binding cassette domain-containing protein [Bacteroidota bacterium]
MDSPFLKIEGVTKAYDQHVAVDGVSLNIPYGKIYGLLGPNGAGKTSIIRMITGITRPDAGEIYFGGEKLNRSHSTRTGYMPETRGLYPKMKVLEQLVYLLSLKGMTPKKATEVSKEWLELLDLTDWAQRKVTDLSKGMQQKVQFISTVAHEPELLILDEPFSGLDPVNAQLIEEKIYELKAKGTTIIFSTHRMEQVEELCDYIGLINQGKLMLENEITQVRRDFQEPVYRLDFVGEASALVGLQGVQIEKQTDKSAMLRLDEGYDPKDVLRQLIDSPLEIITFELHLPRLQEIFIKSVSGHDPMSLAERTAAASSSTSDLN